MNHRRFGKVIALGGLAATLGACNDLLEVQDPSRFTDADLDQAIEAVARGVEGDFQSNIDDLANLAAILSDEFKHTGTWSGWDDIDHGLARYENDGSSDGGTTLLRARFAAQDALRRFARLEAEGTTVDAALRAQVAVTEGWIDLTLAQHFCESVSDPVVDADGTLEEYGNVLTDQQMYAQAVDKLRAAAGISPGSDFALWAEAGIARGELMLGNFGAANTAATNVLNAAPAGWSKDAQYQISTLENSIVNLSTFDFNHASGLREKWWPYMDDDARRLNNPWGTDNLGVNEPDPRLEARHESGVLGVDGTTDFHSQWKYQEVGDDVPITHLDEMRLIQAEVAWRNGDFATARTILNGLRTAAGLTPAPDAMADSDAEVLDLLLAERFAELYMEGQRANDLYRFNLTPALMTAGDFVETVPQRLIKFPMASNEARDNPNIEDDANSRCAPLASAG